METVIDILSARLADRPDSSLYTFIDRYGKVQLNVTPRMLDQQGRHLAARMLSNRPDIARVLLLLPSGPALISGLLGAMYAGAIAVPFYVSQTRRLPAIKETLGHVLRAASPDAVVTEPAISPELRELVTQHVEESCIYTIGPSLDVEVAAQTHGLVDSRVLPEIAIIQFTSGSTQAPRGVRLTHRNLISQLSTIQRAFSIDAAEDSAVMWVPPTHDMGLVGGLLEPLYAGIRTVLMSPSDFVANPRIWLEAITTYEATISGGPNFAYEMCVRRIPQASLGDLDLRKWRLAFNGAETIRSSTLREFADHFRGCGFDAAAFFPCYGLAEATLMVSGGGRPDGPTIKTYLRSHLQGRSPIGSSGGVQEAAKGTVELVGCGPPLDCQLAIVDTTGLNLVDDGQVGEICVAGDSISPGYESEFDGTPNAPNGRRWVDRDGREFLRTGDLGFLDHNELFIVGRIDDAIEINGMNYMPDDIERVAGGAHAAIRPGGCAATRLSGDRPRVGVLCELRRTSDLHRAAEIEYRIRRSVRDVIGLHVGLVRVLPPGQLPRTATGKLQRFRARTLLESQENDGLPIGTGDRDIPRIFDAAVARIGAAVGISLEPTELDRSIGSLGLDSLSVLEIAEVVLQFTGRYRATEIADGNLTIYELLCPAGADMESDQGTATATRQGKIEPRRTELGRGTPVGRYLWPDSGYPLLPEQLRYLDPEAARPPHWISATVSTLEPLENARVERAVKKLVLAHETLRSTINYSSGLATAETGISKDCYAEVWLESDAADGFERWLRDEVNKIQLDIGGQTEAAARWACVRQSGTSCTRIVLLAHHLLVDGWSVRLLVGELLRYLELDSNVIVPSLPRSLPVSKWARRLAEANTASMLERHVSYWKRQLGWPGGVEDPLSRSELRAANTVAGEVRRVDALSAGGSRIHGSGGRRASATASFLTRFALAVGDCTTSGTLWCNVIGTGRLNGLVRHDETLARTAGWLTCRFPLAIPLQRAASESDVFRAVSEQLADVPDGGVGFGVLRYMHESSGMSELRSMAMPAVTVNYVDLSSRVRTEEDKKYSVSVQEHISRTGLRDQVLDIDIVNNGADSLELNWYYNPRAISSDLVNHIASRCVK